MPFRNPTSDELRLIRELALLAGDTEADDWLGTLRVRAMDDGGMGSLELRHAKLPETRSSFGRSLAAVQFTDADGAEVIATLNGNADGIPFELDVWKTDFKPLVRIAESFIPLKE